MNILYIHSHDTGRCIQPYGYPVPTPNLQRLAEEGVVFRQAFCAAPTCSPSRAALLTGQAAHSAGMFGLTHAPHNFRLADPRQHLVNALNAAGYTTVLAGIQHVAPPPQPGLTVGYAQDLSGQRGREGDAVAEAWLDGRPKEPFFLDVGFFETHRYERSFQSDETVADGRYVLPPGNLPDEPGTRADWADYIEAAARLDRRIGRVLDAIDRNGYRDNTLVVCTTDHGIAFPRMKCDLYDGGVGVMFLLRGPDPVGSGRVFDSLVSHVDLFPTLCEWLQIEPPPWLQGRSLLPILRGEADEVHGEIYAEINYHVRYHPARCIRTKRWKFIRRDNPPHPQGFNCDKGPSADHLVALGWRERPQAARELYDLAFDPHETNNLAGRPEHAAIEADLAGRLENWMRETSDPIALHGFAPLPEGAGCEGPYPGSKEEK